MSLIARDELTGICRNSGTTPSPSYSGERVGVRGRARVDDVARLANAKCRPSERLLAIASADVRPLTPALSPEYEGEGKSIE
jgi:hypothetical protein